MKLNMTPSVKTGGNWRSFIIIDIYSKEFEKIFESTLANIRGSFAWLLKTRLWGSEKGIYKQIQLQPPEQSDFSWPPQPEQE